MRIILMVLLIFISTIFAAAQTAVVKAKSYVDVETGKIISPAMIVVENDRIAAINPAHIPEDTRVIDLSHLTLLPGLIDMHTHLTFDLEALSSGLKETAADFALRGAKNARITLMAGFTTVRDVGSNGFADVALSKAVRKGFVVGPDIFPAGHAIGITGGHMDVTGYAPGIAEQDYRTGVGDGRDELLKSTRYQIKHGAKVIKIGATAGVLSFEGPVGAQQLSQDEMEAIVEEATRHGLKVAAHCHGKEGMLAAVLAGVHSIEHGSLIDEEIIDAMKERGTYLVPTTFIPHGIDWSKLPPVMVKKGRQVSDAIEEKIGLAIRSGVKMAFGTDAAVISHGENAKEFGVLVDIGMTAIEAIRGATLHAVDLLGVDDRGIIEVGRHADLIAIEGNPLEDVRLLEEVKFVMKRGIVHKIE